MSIDRRASQPGHNLLDHVIRLCFADVIRYYHDHLDDPSDPEEIHTARDYFREVRGWTDETIEAGLFGWAPPDQQELLDYLDERGYTDEEIRATGLFTKDLRPLWRGRYVLPYLNQEDEPVFAISRATVEQHPDDILSGKYARPATSKPYVHISEPIFGEHSIRHGEPLIITEGIADAITVQQAGYPCLSPVAVKFPTHSQSELLSLLNESEISRVYVIQDAEPPVIRQNAETDQLDLGQLGAGIEGALDTAIFLQENGIDAYVNTPPLVGDTKLDLDAYLREGWGTLGPLLRRAKPPQQHPAYSAYATESKTETNTETPEPVPRREGQSAIYALDITDVTGERVGFRGKNPLGHTGESEDYFHIYEGRNGVRAYDHKRGSDYNALTYLLCDLGERSLESPGGSLSDREHFLAWEYAKDTGLIPKDDPIPHKAIRYVAIKHGLCDSDEITDGWKLPVPAYNEALSIIRDEYGLESGRDLYESVGPATRNTVLLSETPTEWDWRRGSDERLTKELAQERCQFIINAALESGDHVLVDALPTIGKSTGIVQGAAETGVPITVFTERRELYQQLKEYSEGHGLDVYVLGAFDRDCDTAKGKYGDTWKDRVWSLYRSGATAGKIHQKADEYFGRPLPCQEHGECAYTSSWHFEADDYDVIIGHYLHANNPRITAGRVAVFDESCSDSFLTTLSESRIRRALNVYLSQNDALPFDTYDQFIDGLENRYLRKVAQSWFTQWNPDVEPDEYGVFTDQSGDAHVLAPLATYALLFGKKLANGWEHIELPDSRFVARDEDGNLHLLLPPPLRETTGVIALDGTPWLEGWQMSLGLELIHMQVLTDEERAEYLRDVLGLRYIQTNENVKPYSSGKWVTSTSDGLLFRWIYEHHGEKPVLITSQNAIEKYREAGVLGPIHEMEYYGNLKGLNKYQDVRVGIIAGSSHYGDTYVEKWGALAGVAVTANDERGFDRSYGAFGDEILENMREHVVLQAAMRFGRDGKGATVYLHTGAIPEWVPIAGRARLIGEWSDGFWQVYEVIRNREEWSMADIVIGDPDKRVLNVDHPKPIGERQVRRHLTYLTKLGYIECRKEGNGYVWSNVRLDDVDSDSSIRVKLTET